jgi:hypothetical protein
MKCQQTEKETTARKADCAEFNNNCALKSPECAIYAANNNIANMLAMLHTKNIRLNINYKHE